MSEWEVFCSVLPLLAQHVTQPGHTTIPWLLMSSLSWVSSTRSTFPSSSAATWTSSLLNFPLSLLMSLRISNASRWRSELLVLPAKGIPRPPDRTDGESLANWLSDSSWTLKLRSAVDGLQESWTGSGEENPLARGGSTAPNCTRPCKTEGGFSVTSVSRLLFRTSLCPTCWRCSVSLSRAECRTSQVTQRLSSCGSGNVWNVSLRDLWTSVTENMSVAD